MLHVLGFLLSPSMITVASRLHFFGKMLIVNNSCCSVHAILAGVSFCASHIILIGCAPVFYLLPTSSYTSCLRLGSQLWEPLPISMIQIIRVYDTFLNCVHLLNTSKRDSEWCKLDSIPTTSRALMWIWCFWDYLLQFFIWFVRISVRCRVDSNINPTDSSIFPFYI